MSFPFRKIIAISLTFLVTGCSSGSLNKADNLPADSMQSSSSNEVRRPKYTYCRTKISNGKEELLFDHNYGGDDPCYFKTQNDIYLVQDLDVRAKLSDADPQTFEILKTSYKPIESDFYKNNKGEILYREFHDLDGAPPDIYAKDKKHVYYQDHILEGADPATFEPIEQSNFFKDKNFIYYFGQRKEGVDMASFRVVQFNVAVDKNATYFVSYWNELLSIPKVMDADTFESMLGGYYLKDKNEVYFLNFRSSPKQVIGADPATFEPISAYGYSKDKNHVYYQENIVRGADITSFKMVDEGETAQDNKFFYKFGKKTKSR